MSEENKQQVALKKETPIITALPMGEEADIMLKWASMMSETKFYQKMVAEGGKNAVVAVFLAARELNIPPMQAINGGLWIVQGRVTLSAQMMGFMIRRAGHKLIKKTGSKEMCHLHGERKDTGEVGEMIFTIEEARKAGLVKPNGTWEKYPAVMLYNRCLSMLAKQLFQDTIGNSMVEGEIEPIDITPESSVNKAKEDPSTVELLNPKIQAFRTKYKLENPDSDLYRYIEDLAVKKTCTMDDIIALAVKNEENFLEGFALYVNGKRGK